MSTNPVLIFVGYIQDLNSGGNSMIPYYVKNFFEYRVLTE
jgi:hypothetical protein